MDNEKEKVYTFQIGADSIEEFAMEFIRACVASGEFATFKTDSKNPKTWGKLAINGGRTANPFDSSYAVEWPDVRINGLQPSKLNLTLQVSDLQKPTAHKQTQATRAATILADIAKLQEEARRLGVPVPSAGEQGD